MINPLTLEERTNVAYIIDHDIMSHLDKLTRIAYNDDNRTLENDRTSAYCEATHISTMLKCITILSTYDENCHFQKTSKSKLEESSEILKEFQDILKLLILILRLMIEPNSCHIQN